jgi:putative mycofactocin binding protein MftB
MTRYVLDPACRVRKEKFGLLFYDVRGPKLLFAETGDLVRPDFFERGGTAGDALSCGPGAEPSRRLEQFLDLLVRKGFLHEQPVR